jgi:ankyrin repeat protein
MRQDEQKLLERVGSCVYEALIQVCGGDPKELQPSSLVGDCRKHQFREIAIASISFPNRKSTSADGKPHDIEVRVALSLYHRWKRNHADGSVPIISDLGLVRTITSPRDLARILCEPLEEACRDQQIAHDVRFTPSGIIYIVTYARAQLLRVSGKLPCPHCTHWCKGEKGLWWHQQQNHQVEHSQAAAVASTAKDVLAIIPYNPVPLLQSTEAEAVTVTTQPSGDEDPLYHIKNGDLASLKKGVQNGYDPSTVFDNKGASPLMWAAGGGHLDMVRYLIEECLCLPGQPQRGKRSFSGRTALHWAARNGHLPVVDYLVDHCQANLEDATIDGTTAFCWACWQCHLSIMKFLHEKGCNIHSKNSFGCNAVLWCAQGKGDVSAMEWLRSNNCRLVLVNHNGHGVLHKAGQRGQPEVCEWFVTNIISGAGREDAVKLVGPDTEGYCPSDLAGMEGHEELAKWIARVETELIRRLFPDGVSSSTTIPDWLSDEIANVSMRMSEKEQYTWEKYAGLRRMRSALSSSG